MIAQQPLNLRRSLPGSDYRNYYHSIPLGMKRLPLHEWVEILRAFVLPFAWIFALSALGLQRIHGTRPVAGLAFSVRAMIPTGIIMAVFIR